jgi:alkylhydroperoxidase family enzyme
MPITISNIESLLWTNINPDPRSTHHNQHLDKQANPNPSNLSLNTKMRLPYVQNPPPTKTEDESRILASVQARRAPNPLLPLDLALLHSYPVTEGWNSFIGAIRTRTSLSAVVRELAICRVAVVNGALFEWEQHAPLLQQGGLSEEALKIVGDAQADFKDESSISNMSAEQRAVLRYTDAMTKTVAVPDEVFEELRACFDEKEIVEITATVAAYNCVSRFLVALDVGEKNH